MRIVHYTSNSLAMRGLHDIIDNDSHYTILDCSSESLLHEVLGNSVNLLVIGDPLMGERSRSLLSSIHQKHPELPILVIGDTTDPGSVLKTIDDGIMGFLTKECDVDEITHAIHAVAKGERFFCNNVLNILLNRNTPEQEDCDPTSLTQRELEVIREIARGLTSKQVGEKLHISRHTVQTHRKNIMRKLQVGSVSELILYAIRTGLVKSDVSP